MKRLLSVLLALFFLAFTGYFLYKIGVTAYEKYTLQLQINAIQAETRRLERDSEEIKTLVAYLGDREFLKLKTKEDLNVREEGEKVVIIQNDQSYASENTKKDETATRPAYWKKWWNVFLN